MRRAIKNNHRTQCEGKIKHSNQTGAIIEAKKAKDSSISVYKCPHCGGWHIGHASGWVAKRQFMGLRR